MASDSTPGGRAPRGSSAGGSRSGGSRGSGSKPGGRALQGRSGAGKPNSGRPSSGKPGSGRSGSGRSESGKPRSDRTPTGNGSGSRPSGRGGAGKPGGKPGARSGSRPPGKPSGSRPPRRDGDASHRRPPSGAPRLPEGIEAEDLDPSVINELRTLPEELRDLVARRLVAADLAATEGDIPAAVAHAKEAKRLAGRVACVREAAGIANYFAGDYAEALADLRAVRRMRGGDEFLPMMGDCERGLGRPDRALELLRSVDVLSLDPETRAELLIVLAGARADLDQIDAALVTLEVPELTKAQDPMIRERMQFTYADLLERAGRLEDARDWFTRASTGESEAAADAAARLVRLG
ncbi:MAG: hypothetical protein RJB01_1485 [Actinomycetota bacterium]